jgi:hypothetical protein
VTRDELLVVLFGELPDPFVSLEEGERHAHLDLDRMQADELERERVRCLVWQALSDGEAVRGWLSERLARLSALRARRPYGR